MVVLVSERVTGEHYRLYDLEPRIARLVAGVAIAEQLEDIPVLEGSDSGLYELLKRLAVSRGEIVEDRDEHTAGVLGPRKARGLRKQFYGGLVLMVKQGPPLEMAATGAHENAHRWTVPKVDATTNVLSEVSAEGAAFVGLDYFGLDISARAFPFIADYNNGNFTPEMLSEIRTVSTHLIDGVLRVQQAV